MLSFLYGVVVLLLCNLYPVFGMLGITSGIIALGNRNKKRWFKVFVVVSVVFLVLAIVGLLLNALIGAGIISFWCS